MLFFSFSDKTFCFQCNSCSIVLTVTLLAKHLGCYKMTLDCKDHLIPFYKSIGYKIEQGNANSMMMRFEEKPAIVDPS